MLGLTTFVVRGEARGSDVQDLRVDFCVWTRKPVSVYGRPFAYAPIREVAMKKLALLPVLPLVLLLVHCSDTQSVECPCGQQLNADSTDCVPIPCEGGDLGSCACVCPDDRVLEDGMCQDPDEPCFGVDCDDDNECTTESCDPDTRACVVEDVADGTMCVADGTTAFCFSGVCESDPCADVDCDDGNQCTVNGSCNPATRECEGRGNEPNVTTCDQNGGAICDGQGNCVECNQPVDCPDATEDCKAKSCDSGTCGSNNAATNGTSCDGGAGTCEDGACVPSDLCLDAATRCDDNNECTQNLCIGGTGACDYPQVDNGSTLCDGGIGECVDGQCDLCKRTDCTEPDPCVQDGTCNPVNGMCVPGANEDINTDCTTPDGGRFCDGQGECVECNDNNQCNDQNECTVDSCGGNNKCVFAAAGAEGTACDNGAGICQSGSCTSLVAPFDGDTIQNPAIDVFLSPTGTKEFDYTDQVSDPAGDVEDWVGFESTFGSTTTTQSIWVTLDCSFLPSQIGSTNASATVWEDGVRNFNQRAFCNDGEQRLTVKTNAEKRIGVEFSVGAPDDEQILLNYTLTVKGTQF